MNDINAAPNMPRPAAKLRATLRRLGIDTYQEAVIYMPSDCDICRSEGFESQSRIEVRLNGRSITATLNAVTQGLLREGEASKNDYATSPLPAVFARMKFASSEKSVGH